jgi:hypothetical protein
LRGGGHCIGCRRGGVVGLVVVVVALNCLPFLCPNL